MNNTVTLSAPKTKILDVYVGQYYHHMTLKQVNIVSRITHNLFVLISLEDGNRWREPTKDINHIFDDARDQFELVTSPFTVTPGE